MNISENNSDPSMLDGSSMGSSASWDCKSPLITPAKILASRELKGVGLIGKSVRLTTWSHFVEKFEQLTDVLCGAAQFGVDPCKEERFRDLRNWFLEHYYEHSVRLRKELAKSSQIPFVDMQSSIEPNMDPFEAIFLPRTLPELLAHDQGNLIGLISSVSDAVYSAGD